MRGLEVRKSRSQQHLVTLLSREAGELDAIDAAGHHDVGQNKIELFLPGYFVESFGWTIRLDHGVAQRPKLRHHGFADHRVVVNHQNGLVVSCRARDRNALRRHFLLARAREDHAELGAFANLAYDVDLAVHLLNETIDHAEAEAGTLADFLGG